MAKTLEQIQEQIAKLQAREAKLKQIEADGVIQRIKVAIEAYRFTPEQLFGIEMPAAVPLASAAAAPMAKKAAKTKSKLSTKPKFSDGAGNEWVEEGRGRPGCAQRSPLAKRLRTLRLVKRSPRAPADGNAAQG